MKKHLRSYFSTRIFFMGILTSLLLFLSFQYREALLQLFQMQNSMMDILYNMDQTLNNYLKSFQHLLPIEWARLYLKVLVCYLGLHLFFKLLKKYKNAKAKKRLEKLHRTTTRKNADNLALISASTQMIHDIQSPLAALEIVMDDLNELPQDSKELTLSAIHRIQGIADSVSSENKKNHTVSCISKTIHTLINEKRMEFKKRLNLTIECQVTIGSTQSITINEIELSRILSNLINNSAEANNFEGKIQLMVSLENEKVTIVLSDDGPGFPTSILHTKIKRGNSIGKMKGQGLGLHHASTMINSIGGKFSFYNNNGAHVKMAFPKQLSLT